MIKTYKLSDSTIMQIARCVQLSLLTQTDVTDQLRNISLKEGSEEGMLVPTPEYIVESELYIKELLERAKKLQDEKEIKHN